MKNRSLLAIAVLGAVLAAPAAQERPIRRFGIPALITHVAFSPDGRNVVAWDPAGWSTWDAESGRQAGREPVFARTCGRIATLPRSEDGRTIGVNCGGRLLIFGAGSTEAVGEWKLGDKEIPILFTAAPDGAFVAAVVAGATGTLQVADRSGGKAVATLKTSEEVEHAEVAPGGKMIATGGISGVRLWTLPDGKETAHIEGGAALALSGDGQTLAVARSGGAALVQVASGTVQRELEGPSTQLRFSEDGRRLAGLNNQQVVVWDARTGAQRLVLKSEEFVAMALSADGLRLATVSRELRGQSTGTTIAIWRVPPPE